MRPDLLETIVCCPACGSRLELVGERRQHGEIWEGSLHCPGCGRSFPIRQGMPHLYVDESAWSGKAREAEGWVTLHQQMDMYEQGEDAVDLQIPYYPEEPWIQVRRSFDIALDHLKLTGEETVLDLGAGRGWAAKHFALQGCRVVALDITPDENVGLGRGKALMDNAGTYFERVIGDGEQLPFYPETFDIVFCAAALHHSSDLPLLLHNVCRVLKKGGQLCAINEPSIGILEKEEAVLARDAGQEMDLGINETRPNFKEYGAALEAAGLEMVQAYPAVTHHMSTGEIRALAQQLGAIFEPMDLRRPRQHWRGYITFLQKRLWALRTGRWPSPGRAGLSERERLLQAILLWSGNELFLLARRP